MEVERICNGNRAHLEEKRELKEEVQELKKTLALLIKSHVKVLMELKSFRREKKENNPLFTSTPKRDSEW